LWARFTAHPRQWSPFPGRTNTCWLHQEVSALQSIPPHPKLSWRTENGVTMGFLIISKSQMDEIKKACSKQAGKQVEIIEECQKTYLIKIKWILATGTTTRQKKENLKKNLTSLPPIPSQSEFNIHFFVDTQNNFLTDSTKKDSEEYYKAKHVPAATSDRDGDILLKELKEGVALKDGILFKALKKAGESTGEVRLSVNKDTFEKVKQILIWADDMRASFWHAKRHGGFATGRLNMSAEDGREEADGHARVLVFEAQMLISPVDYLASEISKNIDNPGNPIVKNTRRDWPGQRAAYKKKRDEYVAKNIYNYKEWANIGALKARGTITINSWVAINGEASFATLGSIASSSTTYGDWDYKVHVGNVWGDYVRLGNDILLCPHDTFSNFHYGYLSAAAKLSLRTTLALGDWGQFIASGSREKRKDDDAATMAGYNAHAKNTADKTKLEAEKIRTELIRTELMVFLRNYIRLLNITKVPELTDEKRAALAEQRRFAWLRYLNNPVVNEDEIWKE
jgi:hypothetical protein